MEFEILIKKHALIMKNGKKVCMQNFSHSQHQLKHASDKMIIF